MSVLSFHGSADDPRAVRIVDDRFHWSILFFAPVALALRRQWVLLALWFALAGLVVGMVAGGVLRPWAGFLLILLAQWALALEAPEARRRAFAKTGLPPFAVLDSDHARVLAASRPRPPREPRRFAWPRSFRPPWRPRDERPVSTNESVLGVFPEPGERT